MSATRFVAVPDEADGAAESSVVMPCLNEADTVAACIRNALAGLGAAMLRR
jgi:hypothetical protein